MKTVSDQFNVSSGSTSPENQSLNATADETITEIVPPIFHIQTEENETRSGSITPENQSLNTTAAETITEIVPPIFQIQTEENETRTDKVNVVDEESMKPTLSKTTNTISFTSAQGYM